MRKSQTKPNPLVKLQPPVKTQQQPDSQPSCRSLIFPKNAFRNQDSSLQSSLMTDHNVSIFQPPQTASRSRQKSKLRKNQKVSQKLSQKVKQEHSVSVKIEDGAREGRKSQILVQPQRKIGIETSAEFNQEDYEQNPKKSKKAKQKRANKETKQEKESLSINQAKEEVNKNSSSDQAQNSQTVVEQVCLIDKCPYHIIDFKLAGTEEEFNPETDIMYVLAPKFSTKQTESSEFPSQLLLTASQICESQKLFIELVRFYQNLGSELNLIPYLTN